MGGCVSRSALIYLAGGSYGRTCTREIVKESNTVARRGLGSAAPGGLTKPQLRSVLEEYGFSWFSQNEEAPQCPQKNYEKLMQTFERKEGREKAKKKEHRCICLIYDYMEPRREVRMRLHLFQPILPQRGRASSERSATRGWNHPCGRDLVTSEEQVSPLRERTAF